MALEQNRLGKKGQPLFMSFGKRIQSFCNVPKDKAETTMLAKYLVSLKDLFWAKIVFQHIDFCGHFYSI